MDPTSNSRVCRACSDFKSWMKTGPPGVPPKTSPTQPKPTADQIHQPDPIQDKEYSSETKSELPPIESPLVQPQSESSSEGDQKVQSHSSSEGDKKEESEPIEDIAEVDLATADHAAGVCPPDTVELGRSSWGLLHSVAAYFPDKPTEQQQQDGKNLLSIVSRLYPCEVRKN